jgi:hypothetical protein
VAIFDALDDCFRQTSYEGCFFTNSVLWLVRAGRVTPRLSGLIGLRTVVTANIAAQMPLQLHVKRRYRTSACRALGTRSRRADVCNPHRPTCIHHAAIAPTSGEAASERGSHDVPRRARNQVTRVRVQ